MRKKQRTKFKTLDQVSQSKLEDDRSSLINENKALSEEINKLKQSQIQSKRDVKKTIALIHAEYNSQLDTLNETLTSNSAIVNNSVELKQKYTSKCIEYDKLNSSFDEQCKELSKMSDAYSKLQEGCRKIMREQDNWTDAFTRQRDIQIKELNSQIRERNRKIIRLTHKESTTTEHKESKEQIQDWKDKYNEQILINTKIKLNLQEFKDKFKQRCQYYEEEHTRRRSLVDKRKKEHDLFVNKYDELIGNYITNKVFYTIDDKGAKSVYSDELQEQIGRILHNSIQHMSYRYNSNYYIIVKNEDGQLVQRNNGTGRTREIRQEQISDIAFPPYWPKGKVGDPVQYISLDSTDKYYKMVVDYFKQCWYKEDHDYYVDPNTLEFNVSRIINFEKRSQYMAVTSEDKDKLCIERFKADPELYYSTGEYKLWHGTTSTSADNIANRGFKCFYSGSGSGCMYGRGCYFGYTQKADQYTQREDDGWKTMLLCGIKMGKVYQTTTSHWNMIRPPEDSDSIFAESGVANGGNQINDEFVVYSTENTIAEYTVRYRQST